MQALEIFAEQKRITTQDVLENPQNYLGINYKTILNFWIFIETFTVEQWRDLEIKMGDLDDWVAYRNEALKIEQNTNYLQFASWAVLFYKFNELSLSVPIYATYEIIAMHQLIEEGKKLYILPLFETL